MKPHSTRADRSGMPHLRRLQLGDQRLHTNLPRDEARLFISVKELPTVPRHGVVDEVYELAQKHLREGRARRGEERAALEHARLSE